MSEKRFSVENDIMYDKEREAHFVKMEEVASFLNPLSSENDYLKKENEQLRQEIVRLKDDLQYYKTKSARLEEELLSTRC